MCKREREREREKDFLAHSLANDSLNKNRYFTTC